jgi:uncharacterized glyoxalase superfamily protein PhnB
VDAGARVIIPMTDMFFGSREGRVADPYGNVWTIATLGGSFPGGNAARDEELGC